MKTAGLCLKSKLINTFVRLTYFWLNDTNRRNNNIFVNASRRKRALLSILNPRCQGGMMNQKDSENVDRNEGHSEYLAIEIDESGRVCRRFLPSPPLFLLSRGSSCFRSGGAERTGGWPSAEREPNSTPFPSSDPLVPPESPRNTVGSFAVNGILFSQT
jgi:hypothetical protein